MTSSLAKSKQIIGAHFQTFFSTIFLFLTFLNIHIYFIILKTFDQKFILTTKKSLHIIFKHLATVATVSDTTWRAAGREFQMTALETGKSLVRNAIFVLVILCVLRHWWNWSVLNGEGVTKTSSWRMRQRDIYSFWGMDICSSLMHSMRTVRVVAASS